MTSLHPIKRRIEKLEAGDEPFAFHEMSLEILNGTLRFEDLPLTHQRAFQRCSEALLEFFAMEKDEDKIAIDGED